MSPQEKFPERENTSNMQSLWKKIGEIVVLTITLILIYSLLAFWGVIVLIMAGFAKAGVILRREATKKALQDRS